MGEVKGQGHIVYPVSNRCTTLSFHVNRTNHSWDMANRLFDFEKSKVKVTGEVKGQGHIIYPTDSLPFVSRQSDPPFLRYGQKSAWTWKIHP